jgi:ribosome maturation factor RimP
MSLRKPAAALLVACLLSTSIPGTAATTDLDGLKRKVDLWGSGAQIKLKLSDGKKLRGQLTAIDDDAFLVASAKGPDQRRIAFGEVAQIQPAKKDYRAAGVPDATEARRAVVGLGVGHHVMVRLADRVLRGHIGSIESGQFTLLPDGGAEPVAIEYASVHHVRKNPSTGTIVAIAVGAALATILIVVWAFRDHNE